MLPVAGDRRELALPMMSYDKVRHGNVVASLRQYRKAASVSRHVRKASRPDQ
ncbi:hypothetical protein [Dactylosporangium sp. CA-092794]|uniref:hypothetical protein n=1 Tax=Dactylosporangium sp. CA-092794 TaxID=3239929 RepID=UPI003D8FAD09